MNFLDLYKKIKELEDNVEQRKVNEGLSQGNMMPQAVSAPPSGPISECGMSECGDMPMPSHDQHAPEQQDSVSMSVNINGAGKGGIRDLIDILTSLENKAHEKDVTIGVDHDEPHDDQTMVIGGDDTDSAISNIETELETMATDVEEPAFEEPAFEMPEEEMPEEEIVDDGYENEPAKFDKKKVMAAVSAVIDPPSDDLHKSKMMWQKAQDGDNPRAALPIAEGLISKLANHYNEVKSRTNEGYRDDDDWGSMDQEEFKRREHEIEYGGEEHHNGYLVMINGKGWKAFRSKRQAESVVRTLKAKGKNASLLYGAWFE